MERYSVNQQPSFDPSIYSMDSFDPSSLDGEYDPSDDEEQLSNKRDSIDSMQGRHHERRRLLNASQDLDEEKERSRKELDQQKKVFEAELAASKSECEQHIKRVQELQAKCDTLEANALKNPVVDETSTDEREIASASSPIAKTQLADLHYVRQAMEGILTLFHQETLAHDGATDRYSIPADAARDKVECLSEAVRRVQAIEALVAGQSDSVAPPVGAQTPTPGAASEEEAAGLRERIGRLEVAAEQLQAHAAQAEGEARRAAERAAGLEAQLAAAQQGVDKKEVEIQEAKLALLRANDDNDKARRKIKSLEEDVEFLEGQLKEIAQADAPPHPSPPPSNANNAAADRPGAVAGVGPAATSPDRPAAEDAGGGGEGGSRSVGLGFTFKRDSKTGDWQVNRLKPGGFAEQCGGAIATGDVIISVDGRAVRGLSQAELGALVMGPEGSHSNLVLRRGGPAAPPVEIAAVRLKSRA